jgi:DtxR family Mn-dependent transcriptional regulator
VNLVDAVRESDSEVTARIRRLGEPAQVDPELLLQLKQAGVFPGSTGTFAAAGSYVSVQVDGFDTGLELPNELAAHIFVDA